MNRVFFVGAEKRIRAFSGAPRFDVINVVLCRRAYRNPTAARQSVLLSQNGSPLESSSILVTQAKAKSTLERVL